MEVILCLYGISSIISVFTFIGTYSESSMYFLCPKCIYEITKLNIFGVIIASIILIAIFPLYYITWFSYWICHVGRR